MDIFSVLSKTSSILRSNRRKRYIQSLLDRGLTLGKNVEIIEDFFFDPSHCFLISIGDNCTICPNVRLIAHDASSKKFLGYTKLGTINIKDNCFLGDSTIVLLGVTIGPNAIIGAGSVVTRDIPPNTVAAGNPARVLCSLEDYLSKIETRSAGKTIFTEEYSIERLDGQKRQEIIDSISGTIGLMV